MPVHSSSDNLSSDPPFICNCLVSVSVAMYAYGFAGVFSTCLLIHFPIKSVFGTHVSVCFSKWADCLVLPEVV